MNLIAHVVILGLASWRLSSLIANEDGPSDVLEKIRHTLGVRYDEYSMRHVERVVDIRLIGNLLQTIGSGAICIWCNSVWTATILGGLYIAYGEPVVLAAMIPAISTAVILVNKYANPST